jgi:predicted N-acetyltransferase YhbS
LSFRYFAYGSNLWTPQIRSRCPSATPLGTASLEGWRLLYDKPSTDGSAKLNIRPDPDGTVEGVVYRVDDGDRARLDEAEPRYTPKCVEVAGEPTLTYCYEGEAASAPPYDWYVAMARLGAASHGVDDRVLAVDTVPDALAPGLRPGTLDDIGWIRSLLSEGLKATTDRYYIHPGDYEWWVHHDDPRYHDHLSTWIQGDLGFVTIDSRPPREIGVFTRTEVDRLPLLRWAQRRLGGRGTIGWVDDADRTLIPALQAEGFQPADSNPWFRWDLTRPLPPAELPGGWGLRPVAGEEEANARRAASHAAFGSTMPPAIHLQRYLGFMRSPAYVPDHDLIAVSPEGTVAAFMMWWADDSGVAQIEPLGTHPHFQRRGIGRALVYHGLSEMKAAGMHTARVVTDTAGAFYRQVGFEPAGRLRWWQQNL